MGVRQVAFGKEKPIGFSRSLEAEKELEGVALIPQGGVSIEGPA